MLTVDFRIFRPKAGEQILDAGCGEGRHALALFTLGCRVVALDPDWDSLRKSRFFLKDMQKPGSLGRAAILQGDSLQLPFEAGAFHKIICSEMLEHVAEDHSAVRELFRVLREGGEMAVTVPTCFTERVYGWISAHYFKTPGGHIRIYRPQEISRLLTDAGLRIYAVHFAHSFHSPYWILKCLCGLHNERARLPKIYHGFLRRVVQDPLLSLWERSCNFLFPKSMVIYTQKLRPLKTS